MMNLYVTAASRTGRVRPNNEDMVLVGSSFIRNDYFRTKIELGPGKRTIFAVADGMGGHKSGEVASSDALHNLQFFFNDIPAGLNAGELNEMLVASMGVHAQINTEQVVNIGTMRSILRTISLLSSTLIRRLRPSRSLPSPIFIVRWQKLVLRITGVRNWTQEWLSSATRSSSTLIR